MRSTGMPAASAPARTSRGVRRRGGRAPSSRRPRRPCRARGARGRPRRPSSRISPRAAIRRRAAARRQRAERRRHRGRVGVVASFSTVTPVGQVGDLHAHARRAGTPRGPRRDRLEVDAERVGRGRGRERVGHVVPARNAETHRRPRRRRAPGGSVVPSRPRSSIAVARDVRVGAGGGRSADLAAREGGRAAATTRGSSAFTTAVADGRSRR